MLEIWPSWLPKLKEANLEIRRLALVLLTLPLYRFNCFLDFQGLREIKGLCLWLTFLWWNRKLRGKWVYWLPILSSIFRCIGIWRNVCRTCLSPETAFSYMLFSMLWVLFQHHDVTDFLVCLFVGCAPLLFHEISTHRCCLKRMSVKRLLLDGFACI